MATPLPTSYPLPPAWLLHFQPIMATPLPTIPLLTLQCCLGRNGLRRSCSSSSFLPLLRPHGSTQSEETEQTYHLNPNPPTRLWGHQACEMVSPARTPSPTGPTSRSLRGGLIGGVRPGVPFNKKPGYGPPACGSGASLAGALGSKVVGGCGVSLWNQFGVRLVI